MKTARNKTRNRYFRTKAVTLRSANHSAAFVASFSRERNRKTPHGAITLPSWFNFRLLKINLQEQAPEREAYLCQNEQEAYLCRSGKVMLPVTKRNLPVEFRTELQNARIANAGHLTERSRVNANVYSVEADPVKDVEGFASQL